MSINKKELMVGDWVCHKDYPSIPLQVDNISNMLELKHSLLWMEESSKYVRIDRDSEIDYEEMIPVLPTEEILLANDFSLESENNYKWFQTDEDNYYFGYRSIYYEMNSGQLTVTNEHKDGSCSQVKAVCKAIHEIQHAIKMCGIEKEFAL